MDTSRVLTHFTMMSRESVVGFTRVTSSILHLHVQAATNYTSIKVCIIT